MVIHVERITLIVKLNLLNNCALSSATRATKIKITDTKIYVRFVTLSTQDNEKLLQQLKSGFKGAINRKSFTRSFTRKTKSIFRFLNLSKFSRSK